MSDLVKHFHFGVYGFLIKSNKILLIKKSRGPYLGKLDSPGGRLEHSESLEEALKRELLEETGLVITEFCLQSAYAHTENYIDPINQQISLHHVGLVYSVIGWDESGLIQNMEYEDSLGAEWYSISDLKASQVSPFARFALWDFL